MTQTTYASAVTSATALNMLALDYTIMRDLMDGNLRTDEAISSARADNAIFVCVECGSYLHATPTAESSREDQQNVLAENFVLDCCGKENMFAI